MAGLVHSGDDCRDGAGGVGVGGVKHPRARYATKAAIARAKAAAEACGIIPGGIRLAYCQLPKPAASGQNQRLACKPRANPSQIINNLQMRCKPLEGEA